MVVNPSFHHVWPRVSRCISGNYCLRAPVPRLLTPSKETVKSGETLKVSQTVTNVVNSSVVNHTHIVKGQPQKKGVSPAVVRQCQSLSVPCGTLVCLWEEFSRKGPPDPLAPQVCLPIASLLVDGISSNLAHIFSSPGKIF